MDDKTKAFYQEVGKRIRSARLKQGLSQATLSELAHISPAQISEIEWGKAKMQVATFYHIAEALQVSADSLLCPDVPEVKQMQKTRIEELLLNCSVKELESIERIISEMIIVFHQNTVE